MPNAGDFIQAGKSSPIPNAGNFIQAGANNNSLYINTEDVEARIGTEIGDAGIEGIGFEQPSFSYIFANKMSDLSLPIGTLMAFILIIVSIAMLVKSIKQNKAIKTNISTDTIDKVKSTSVSLIILHIFGTLAFNALSLIFLIVSIISNRMSTQAKKHLTDENNIEQAQAKISKACLTNAIIACLTIFLAFVGCGISVAILKFINFNMWLSM